jgi:uncharacterized caspase-like protein
MKKLFLLVILAVVTAASLDARKIYIIAAGVSDYPGTANDLTLPANDARSVYTLYRKYAGAEGVLLLNNKATKNNILTKANNLFQKAQEDDIVVLFFSGHGNRGYFYTYDGEMRYDEVRKVFASCKARNKMIFADACFAGDMAEGSGAGRDSYKNIMLFFSSRNNETSFESSRMKNGYFTACLLKALKGAADRNKDRIISAKELFVSVSEGVKKLSDDRQHPVMWGNFDDNMPVFVWKK